MPSKGRTLKRRSPLNCKIFDWPLFRIHSHFRTARSTLIGCLENVGCEKSQRSLFANVTNATLHFVRHSPDSDIGEPPASSDFLGFMATGSICESVDRAQPRRLRPPECSPLSKGGAPLLEAQIWRTIPGNPRQFASAKEIDVTANSCSSTTHREHMR